MYHLLIYVFLLNIKKVEKTIICNKSTFYSDLKDRSLVNSLTYKDRGYNLSSPFVSAP